MKHGRDSASTSDDASDSFHSSVKRRKVKYDTYKQWVSQWDREIQTMSWLDCETEVCAGVKYVTKLKCRICTKFQERIIGKRNFSQKWIDGADSVRTTNIRDHAKSEQHCHAMNLERKSAAQHLDQGPAAYASIARSLTTISSEEMERLRIKFDIAFFVATENMAFTKYPKICEMEARHGVKVGSSYLTNNAAKEFVHFIGKSMKNDIISAVSEARFFSLFLDGSTDRGNIDNELLMVCCMV